RENVEAERGLERKREAVRLVVEVELQLRRATAPFDEGHDRPAAQEVVMQEQGTAGGPPGAGLEVQQQKGLHVELDVPLVDGAARQRIGETDSPAREQPEHARVVDVPIVVDRETETAAREQRDLLRP